MAESESDQAGAARHHEPPFDEEGGAPFGEERRFLLFALGAVELSIELSCLEEIIEPGPITRAPGAPPWVLGAANLRGQALPVIDLAKKLGLGLGAAEGSRPAILIFRPDGGGARLGAWVSGVLGFFEVGEGALGPPPRFGGAISPHLLGGLVAFDGRFVPVLDLALAASAAESIGAAGGAAAGADG